MTQVHFDADDVRHEHAPTHSVLIIDDYRADLTVHFATVAQVDKVIAELVALRAEMDGPPAINGDRHPAEAERQEPETPRKLGITIARGFVEPLEPDPAPEPVPFAEVVERVAPMSRSELRGALAVVAEHAPAIFNEVAPPVGCVKCLDKHETAWRTDYCQRDKGHDGQHAGTMGTRWTPPAVSGDYFFSSPDDSNGAEEVAEPC